MPRVFIVKAVDPNVPSYSVEGILEQLEKGKARIGWSYADNLNLREIDDKMRQGKALTDSESGAKRCRGFLTRVSPGDYLIYPHQPKRGRFVVAKVTGDYGYASEDDSIDGDFRSYRPCELITINPINMHDPIVLSELRYRLGRPGRFSEIYGTQSFMSLLDDLPRAGQGADSSNQVRRRRIVDELSKDIPELIRKEFSQHDFSKRFCRELFDRMGLHYEVIEGPREKGSDIIVTVQYPLLPDESKTIGVQAFAYKETIDADDLREKLTQLLSGWLDHALDYGVLLTTGNCASEGHDIIKSHNEEHTDRPVTLIDGPPLSDLFLRYFYTDQEGYASGKTVSD